MASQSSTLFTIGTLLNRAQEQGMPVRALVQGNWLEGVPVASDSLGVILDNEEVGQYLIRLDAITALVYLRDPVGTEQPETAGMHAEQEQDPAREARPGYAPAARRAVTAGSAAGSPTWG